MFKKISVGSKITALVLILVMVALTAIAVISFSALQTATIERTYANLNTVADLKVDKITTYFGQIAQNIRLTTAMPAVKRGFISVDDIKPTVDEEDTLAVMMENLAEMDEENPELAHALNTFKTVCRVDEVYLINQNKKIIYTTERFKDGGTGASEYLADPDGKTITRSSEEIEDIHYSSIYVQNNQYYMMAAASVFSEQKQMLGYLVARIQVSNLFKMVQDSTGLGSTGETIIAKWYNDRAIFQNPLRHDLGTTLKMSVSDRQVNGGSVYKAVSGQTGYGQEPDYKGTEVLAAWRYVPSVNWGIVVKMDFDEVVNSVTRMRIIFVAAAFVVFLFATMFALVFSRLLTRPLISLKSSMDLLGRGILPPPLEMQNEDEIGQMVSGVNNLVEGLRRTANFAYKIGEGDFQADFKPLSEGDAIGQALIGMRSSLQTASLQDEERNWIVRGVAEIGDILRKYNTLDEMSNEIIGFMCRKIGAVQGALYLLDTDEASPDYNHLVIQASYAYNKRKYLQGSFAIGEGLVGQAAIEQDTILRTEIPDDFVTITSGLLGDKRPNCLLIVPLIANEQVYGAVEFAAFQRFDDMYVRFVQEVSNILARTVFNIQINERTRILLEASQKMSAELQVQQQELRHNAQIMEMTQEELKRTNIELERQIEEVNRTQKRTQLLLENASEIITIYEATGTIRYVSPSIENILGYKAEDVIGSSNIDNVHPDSEDVVDQMFRDLLYHPQEQITIQFLFTKNDGETIWLEATGKNSLDDPAVSGIIVNSRDITERRRAEQEARMRGQMQALSENSPDQITRVNAEGVFFYVNPVIELYTNRKSESFLQKSIYDIEAKIGQGIIDAWKQIIERVNKTKEKVTEEVTFTSTIGRRTVTVSAIPEYNETRQIESILLVSHDISEAKLIQEEIQAKNKKINESINYAKRIQGAILPSENVVKKHLPDMFMLFKPRDVVSGDFPWFMVKGNDVYLAAVDCTGHGVPGALMSLVGYFLLNDIVSRDDNRSPAQILDLLNEKVTLTLRQDAEDSQTKDGMDIALCKYNKETHEFEYAGAHRSLFHLPANQDLEEYKGNKFPIGGGGLYVNKTNFTNYKITVENGDAVFFSSDGYPDQFGGNGPEQRKLGPKRVRETVSRSKGMNMDEANQIFDEVFESWRGQEKQTDDVLLIGIKF